MRRTSPALLVLASLTAASGCGDDAVHPRGDDGGLDAANEPPRDASSDACACAPGDVDTRSMRCGECGEGQTVDLRECEDGCAWGEWTVGSCTSGATCSPGGMDEETMPCPGACGFTQRRDRACSAATCTWGPWSELSECAVCDACGDGTCDAAETCATCADCHYGHGSTVPSGGTPCTDVPPETWRCVYSESLGGNVSQVCRGTPRTWINFNLSPRDCPACVCTFSVACCQEGSPSAGC